MLKTYDTLKKIMQDMGYVFWDEEEKDFAISDYIGESIAFIQFILSIEEAFEVEITDDFLSYDLLQSAQGFANKLDIYLKKCGKKS